MNSFLQTTWKILLSYLSNNPTALWLSLPVITARAHSQVSQLNLGINKAHGTGRQHKDPLEYAGNMDMGQVEF